MSQCILVYKITKRHQYENLRLVMTIIFCFHTRVNEDWYKKVQVLRTQRMSFASVLNLLTLMY